MKSTTNFLIVLVILLVGLNLAGMTRDIDCSYSNASGTFTFGEMNFKERNFDMCKRTFAEFKKQNSDTILYRLCRTNLLEFWNWGNYLFREKFRLPYRPWKKIELKRASIKAKSGFQDF